MITEKAKELAELAKRPGQSEEEENTSYSNFMDELYSNCDPTLEEFSQLVGDEFFGVKEYYDFHFKNPMWNKVVSTIYNKRPTQHGADGGQTPKN